MTRLLRRTLVVLGCAGAVGGSVAFAGRGEPARDALGDARRQVLNADYLVVTQGERQVFYSDARTVIKRGGRVVAWESARESFTLSKRRCYERHTDWNRADARDMRDSAAFSDLGDARLVESSEVRRLFGREDSFDGPTLVWVLRLDARDRPVTLRQRTGYDKVDYSDWHTTRYEFLDGSEFNERAGVKPKETCR